MTVLVELQPDSSRLESALSKISSKFSRINQEVDKTSSKLNKINSNGIKTDGSVRELQKLNTQFAALDQRLQTTFKGVATSIQRTVAGLATLAAGGGMVAALTNAADKATQLENRIALVTGRTKELTQVQQELYEISARSYGSIDNTLDSFNRLGMALKDAGTSTRDILTATETIQKALVIGGSSVEGGAAAIMQLGQGLASGTLRGEELNSVLEQATPIARAIADHLGVGLGQLREIAKEGALTTDVVLSAMLSQSEKLNEQFALMNPTLAQMRTVAKDVLTRYLADVDAATGVSRNLAAAIQWFIGIIQTRGEGANAVLYSWATNLRLVREAVVVVGGGIVNVLGAALGRLADTLPRVWLPFLTMLQVSDTAFTTSILKWAGYLGNFGMWFDAWGYSLTGSGWRLALWNIFNAKNIYEMRAALDDLAYQIETYGKKWFNVGNHITNYLRDSTYILTTAGQSLSILKQDLINVRFTSFERLAFIIPMFKMMAAQVARLTIFSEGFINVLAILELALKQVGNVLLGVMNQFSSKKFQVDPRKLLGLDSFDIMGPLWKKSFDRFFQAQSMMDSFKRVQYAFRDFLHGFTNLSLPGANDMGQWMADLASIPLSAFRALKRAVVAIWKDMLGEVEEETRFGLGDVLGITEEVMELLDYSWWKLYNDVVGNSYYPDMMDEVISQTGRLKTVLEITKRYLGKIGDAWFALQKRVSSMNIFGKAVDGIKLGVRMVMEQLSLMSLDSIAKKISGQGLGMTSALHMWSPILMAFDVVMDNFGKMILDSNFLGAFFELIGAQVGRFIYGVIENIPRIMELIFQSLSGLGRGFLKEFGIIGDAAVALMDLLSNVFGNGIYALLGLYLSSWILPGNFMKPVTDIVSNLLTSTFGKAKGKGDDDGGGLVGQLLFGNNSRVLIASMVGVLGVLSSIGLGLESISGLSVFFGSVGLVPFLLFGAKGSAAVALSAVDAITGLIGSLDGVSTKGGTDLFGRILGKDFKTGDGMTDRVTNFFQNISADGVISLADKLDATWNSVMQKIRVTTAVNTIRMQDAWAAMTAFAISSWGSITVAATAMGAKISAAFSALAGWGGLLGKLFFGVAGIGVILAMFTSQANASTGVIGTVLSNFEWVIAAGGLIGLLLMGNSLKGAVMTQASRVLGGKLAFMIATAISSVIGLPFIGAAIATMAGGLTSLIAVKLGPAIAKLGLTIGRVMVLPLISAIGKAVVFAVSSIITTISGLIAVVLNPLTWVAGAAIGVAGVLGLIMFGEGDGFFAKLNNAYQSVLTWFTGLTTSARNTRAELSEIVKMTKVGNIEVKVQERLDEINFNVMSDRQIETLRRELTTANRVLDRNKSAFESEGMLTRNQIMETNNVLERIYAKLDKAPTGAEQGLTRSMFKAAMPDGLDLRAIADIDELFGADFKKEKEVDGQLKKLAEVFNDDKTSDQDFAKALQELMKLSAANPALRDALKEFGFSDAKMNYFSKEVGNVVSAAAKGIDVNYSKDDIKALLQASGNMNLKDNESFIAFDEMAAELSRLSTGVVGEMNPFLKTLNRDLGIIRRGDKLPEQSPWVAKAGETQEDVIKRVREALVEVRKTQESALPVDYMKTDENSSVAGDINRSILRGLWAGLTGDMAAMNADVTNSLIRMIDAINPENLGQVTQANAYGGVAIGVNDSLAKTAMLRSDATANQEKLASLIKTFNSTDRDLPELDFTNMTDKTLEGYNNAMEIAQKQLVTVANQAFDQYLNDLVMKGTITQEQLQMVMGNTGRLDYLETDFGTLESRMNDMRTFLQDLEIPLPITADNAALQESVLQAIYETSEFAKSNTVIVSAKLETDALKLDYLADMSSQMTQMMNLPPIELKINGTSEIQAATIGMKTFEGSYNEFIKKAATGTGVTLADAEKLSSDWVTFVTTFGTGASILEASRAMVTEGEAITTSDLIAGGAGMIKTINSVASALMGLVGAKSLLAATGTDPGSTTAADIEARTKQMQDAFNKSYSIPKAKSGGGGGGGKEAETWMQKLGELAGKAGIEVEEKLMMGLRDGAIKGLTSALEKFKTAQDAVTKSTMADYETRKKAIEVMKQARIEAAEALNDGSVGGFASMMKNLGSEIDMNRLAGLDSTVGGWLAGQQKRLAAMREELPLLEQGSIEARTMSSAINMMTLQMQAAFEGADKMKQGFETAFTAFVTGEKSFKDFIGDIVDTFTKTVMETFSKGFTNMIWEGMGLDSLFTGLFGSVFGIGASAGGKALGSSALNPMWVQMADGMLKGVPGLNGDGDAAGGFLKQLTGENGLLGGITKSIGGLFSGLSSGLSGLISSIGGGIGGGGGGSKFGGLLSMASSFLPFFAEGGRVSGPGTGTSDSILARLSNGEFVVNAASAAAYMPLLEAINSDNVPAFAKGGQVGPSRPEKVQAAHKVSMEEQASVYARANTSNFAINVTGDVSAQTRREVVKMVPELAVGINSFNKQRMIGR